MTNIPFSHVIIDNFLDINQARLLASEFPDYNDPSWFFYNNPLEHKKSLNSWYLFPKATYSFFCYLNSQEFINTLREKFNILNLYPDPGLHGAGWHIHESGGKLNIHLDYSLHPKLHLQRKLNLILYLSEEWKPEYGGNLELWSHNSLTNSPEAKVKTVNCQFNRAVIFDTTENSWHGFPEELSCPAGMYRKSIAMYYLIDPPAEVDTRTRALYAPYKEQCHNSDVLKLINDRSK